LLPIAAFHCGCGPNSDGSKLRELEKIQTEIPVFPLLIETKTDTVSKGRIAVLSKIYKCDAPYDDVKKYYIDQLSERGWQYVGEREIRDWGTDLGGSTFSFRNGEYRLSITYAGSNANYGWDYAIETVWGR